MRSVFRPGRPYAGLTTTDLLRDLVQACAHAAAACTAAAFRSLKVSESIGGGQGVRPYSTQKRVPHKLMSCLRLAMAPSLSTTVTSTEYVLWVG